MTTTTIPGELDPALREGFEKHRRELTGYCYRMLGSPSEADDAVQDTLLKAWQAYDRFEGRSSLRSWLYRIAHNVCMDMHRSPQRRARPMEMGPSSRTSEVVLGDQLEEHAFIQPARDQDVLDLDGDPADVAAARESIRLAFVAALQHLPAKQRSALILCDVLRWPAADVAELLETTVASVNSALQRARATLAARRDEPLDTRLDPVHEELLARYVEAFERYDIPAVVQLMREDAILTMPPWDTWLQGRDDVGAWMLGPGKGCEGSRLIPLDVNGTAGYASYKPGPSGKLEPWAIQVIEVAGGRIVGHHNFIGADLFAHFGLPPHLDA
ncbi:MAG TPA: sigma-70 family RNA polymerase sigma factor [Acidimicrobiales bacterium]|nr:sigma-70 family RNA polymerase sigma factor [Acidimicrobiales bacterium]